MIHGTGPKYQKGPPLDLSTVQALGQAGSTATGLMGTIAGIIQGEQNLKRTLQEANAQAISVEGSDDIDLLNYYNFDNKLFYTRYYISDRLQSEVDKLFYYAGYATNQTKIPNLNTRVNFNFIQMDLKLKQDKLNSDVDEDIKARLQIGVTFHHEYNGTYDFDQECENLERAVWEEIN